MLVIVVLVFPFGFAPFFWLLYAGQAFKVYTDGEVVVGKFFSDVGIYCFVVCAMIGLFTMDLDDVWFGVACDEKRVYGTAFAKSVQEVLSSLLDCLPFEVPFETFRNRHLSPKKSSSR